MQSRHNAWQRWMLIGISFWRQVDRPEDRATVGNDIRESAVQLEKNLRRGRFSGSVTLVCSDLINEFPH